MQVQEILCIILSFLSLLSLEAEAEAARIDITNRCPFVVWAAATPGGGMELNPGDTWPLQVDNGQPGRIWGRTNCVFDGSGIGKCKTGDCGGVLQCKDGGQPPKTLVEYSLGQLDTTDFFDITLIDGFNVPMEFSPSISNKNCTVGVKCLANINDDCPAEWKVGGGCINPCSPGNCTVPTNDTRFFKDRCPDADSFSFDDRTATKTCPSGADYNAVFCPNNILRGRIHIKNNCSDTVWAAANPGGGKQLKQGETWTFNVTSQNKGRIWGRINCKFDRNGENGKCESGDCDGLLECEADGRAPYTFAEYTLRQNGTDSYSIWVVNGFNIPMEFSPAASNSCRRIECAADINGPCPMELRDPGGCNSPCTVFRNNQFCCSSGICEPTSYSKFFKNLCPDAYSYQYDDASSLFSCPNGNDYNIMFCP